MSQKSQKYEELFLVCEKIEQQIWQKSKNNKTFVLLYGGSTNLQLHREKDTTRDCTRRLVGSEAKRIWI